MTILDRHDATAMALSRAIHRREVSCQAVMEHHLARIDELNPVFNALVSLRDHQVLLSEARRHDALLATGASLGWMHGLPFAPKDLSDAAGLPTTRGSRLFQHTIASADCLMVARMRAHGGIVVGKSNTPEFGLGSHTTNHVFGATRNAWNPNVSAGGSSGGAAVALALGMLPVADGSDMMGSLRNPAAWNLVYGLRPTPGRVPNLPSPDVFFQQIGVLGPMARTVEDLAALLAVQAGHDPRAPLSSTSDPSIFLQPPTPLDPLRIGWLGDWDGYLPIEPEVLRPCHQAMAWFGQLGHDVLDVAPFFDLSQAWRAWTALRSFALLGPLAAACDDPAKRPSLSPEALWEAQNGLALDARSIHRASVVRSQWHQAVLGVLDQVDVLVLPSAQVSPFPVDQRWPSRVAGRAMDTYHRWMEIAVPGSLAAVPVINVPAGLDDRGLPAGLQLLAKPGQEKLLLDLAHAWEQITPWRQLLPPAISARGQRGGSKVPH